MPSDDIVDRLRTIDMVNGMDSDHLFDRLLLDAAEEIERLRRDYSAAEQDHVEYVAKYYNATVEIERLRAELSTYTGDGHTLGEDLAREAL